MTDILKVVPTIQSVALVQNSLNLVKSKKKKKLVKNAIDTIVGTTLIKTESDFLAGF